MSNLSSKQYLDYDGLSYFKTKLNDIYLKYVPRFPTMTGTAAKTSSPYNHAKWDASDSSITSLYDGLVMEVVVPVAGNGTYGTAISVNSGDYHPVVYNVSSMVSTRYSVNSTIIVVYNSTAVGKLYINSTVASDVTGCWQVMDYSTNTAATQDYYFRPYAGANAVYRYKLVAQDKDNRMTPIVLTNQTNTTIVEKTPTSVAFRPHKIWLYNSTSTISASGQFGAQTIYSLGYLANGCTYNFNTDIPVRNMIYLKGTYDKATGLFTLDTTKNSSNQYRNYYKIVPYNTANITLSSYLTEGDYILVGCCYSSQNYLQVFMVNPMYHFDGTNLIPYETYRTNTHTHPINLAGSRSTSGSGTAYRRTLSISSTSSAPGTT